MAALILAFFGMLTEVSPTVEDVLSEWKSRETEFATIDVSWQVVRDSRTPSFGFSNDRFKSNDWRLRIENDRWRIDGHRRIAISKDLPPRLVETDPARARIEFRRILLDERLEGEQLTPRTEEVAVVRSKGMVETNRAFGEIEESLVEAALWGIRPLLLINPKVASANNRTSGLGNYAVVEEAVSSARSRVVWVDATSKFRIVRVVEKENDNALSQIDLYYLSPDASVPNAWTAMQFDEEQNVIDFAHGVRSDLRLNPTIASSDFIIAPDLLGDIRPAPIKTSDGIRRVLRSIVDSNWLIATLPTTVLIGGLVWYWLHVGGEVLAGGLILTVSRTVLAALLVMGIIKVLHQTPLFDPPIRESYSRLLAIWNEAQLLRSPSTAEKDWESFAKEATAALDTLSAELARSHARSVAGLQPLVAGRDRTTELVRRDLSAAAKYDLPAMLQDPLSGDDVRLRALTTRLEKIEDHLAGISTYVETSGGDDEVQNRILNLALGISVVTVGLIMVFAIRRQIQGRRLQRIRQAIPGSVLGSV